MIRLSLTISLILALQASGLEPSDWRADLALEHIAKLQQNRDILWDEYEISDALSPTRRDWLETRLKRFSEVHINAQNTYSVLSSRQDGDLAMVVLSITSAEDPFFHQTFALGFCQVAGVWKVAPVNGSFSLTGVGGYNVAENQRSTALEKWALEQVGIERKQGQKELADRYQKEIASYQQEGGALAGESEKAAVEFFLEMCRAKNIYGAMACLRERGSDFDNRRALIKAFSGVSQQLESWEYLLTENYLFTILPSLDDENMVSVGIYAPGMKVSSQILEFRVQRLDGLWQIELPTLLKLNSTTAEKFPVFQKYLLSSANRERLDEIKPELIRQLKSDRYASSETLFKSLQQAVNGQNVAQFLGLLNWQNSSDGQQLSVEQRAEKAESALTLWSALGKSTQSNIKLIDESVGEASSLLTLLFYSSKDDIKFSLMPCSLYSVNGEWSLHPDFDLHRLSREKRLQSPQIAHFNKMVEQIDSIAFRSILPNTHTEEIAARAAVEPASLEALSETYQLYEKSMQSGNIADASNYLWCKPADASELMRFTGYELFRYKSLTTRYQRVDTLHTGRLAAVMMRLKYPEGADEYSFYPAVWLPQGVKILPQLAYYLEVNRGAKLLNAETLEKISAGYDAQFMSDYTHLIALFNAEVEKLQKSE